LALADPAAKATRKGESVLPKSIRDGGGGAQLTESLKDFTKARLNRKRAGRAPCRSLKIAVGA
jgi:hypothetical protein